MQCSYCKEEIMDKAKKCKNCGERLGLWGRLFGFVNFWVGLLSMIVALGSLGIAYLEYQGRVEATQQKEIAEVEREASQDILRKVSPTTLEKAVQENVESQQDSDAYIYLRKGELKKAVQEFNKILEQDPTNTPARKGKIYTETLLDQGR